MSSDTNPDAGPPSHSGLIDDLCDRWCVNVVGSADARTRVFYACRKVDDEKNDEQDGAMRMPALRVHVET